MKEKKLIRQQLVDALNQAISKFDLTSPSKKTQKLIKEASKDISAQLNVDLKKKIKSEVKLSKTKKELAKKRTS